MAIPSGFSEEFLAMTPEQRLERFKAARVADRSELPDDVREALERADREMTERWSGELPEPKVVDMRTRKPTG